MDQKVLFRPQANAILYFSSSDPDVTYQGQNVGDPSHNCAGVLNERRSIFESIGNEQNFRCDPEIDGNFAIGECRDQFWSCSGGIQYRLVSHDPIFILLKYLHLWVARNFV